LITAYPLFPVSDPAGALLRDSPVVDKVFASLRKVSDGLYATISDTSKGLETMCDGGFLYGKDAAAKQDGHHLAS